MKKFEDGRVSEYGEVEKFKLIAKTAMNKIYYADKLDPIDQQLGNYLNNFPERKELKIMFLRETEGVYQFG